MSTKMQRPFQMFPVVESEREWAKNADGLKMVCGKSETARKTWERACFGPQSGADPGFLFFLGIFFARRVVVADIPQIKVLQDLFDYWAGIEGRNDPHLFIAIGTAERIDLVYLLKSPVVHEIDPETFGYAKNPVPVRNLLEDLRQKYR